MDLRPYQSRARSAVYDSLRGARSTILVLPTGTGKTVVFAHIAAHAVENNRRVLILAHREELIEQAVDKLSAAVGVHAAVEMAARKQGLMNAEQMGLSGDEVVPTRGSDGLPLVVVGSVQSMVRRLDRFGEDHFQLVVVDEAHHAPASTYRQILDHFTGAKILGVTATPDRGDKVALREVFEDVAMAYEIKDAIDDGWLVPVHQHMVQCDGLDFSKCRTTAGDLNQGDLDGVMRQMETLHAVAGPTVELAGDRPTLIFTVTVAHAHGLAEVLRGYTQHRVEALDGTSPKEQRREVVEAFKRGEIRYLCNCALFTEGFDAPAAACVAMARPTKSRAFYAQMLGRGTRPLTGVVDGMNAATHEVRRQAIATSGKPDLMVLDFVGNAGRHALVHAIDVLDGEATQPEVSIAQSLLDRGAVNDVLDALRMAREQLRAMELERMRAQARHSFRTMQVDPFMAFGCENREDSWEREATEKQLAVLERAGINCQGFDRAQCSTLIGAMIKRREDGLCTFKQANRLIKAGVDPKAVWTLTMEVASELITELARNRWRTPDSWADRFGGS